MIILPNIMAMMGMIKDSNIIIYNIWIGFYTKQLYINSLIAQLSFLYFHKIYLDYLHETNRLHLIFTLYFYIIQLREIDLNFREIDLNQGAS